MYVFFLSSEDLYGWSDLYAEGQMDMFIVNIQKYFPFMGFYNNVSCGRWFFLL